ncbi:MAG: ATP-binding protein [Patescibacteria group bacterium]
MINKLRYTLNQDNGVEESLDIYDGVLVPFGLVKFEREGSLDESLPLGIHDAVKVTNTVSDQQLAELCEEIQLGMWEGVGPEVLMEQILDPIRTTVITGPPGSGKTSVLKVLKTAMGHQIHFLDEVARMVITGCNCPVPIDFPSEMKRFERLVMSTQQTVHKFGLQRARLAGKKILVSDRFLDPVAYLGPGLNRGQKETILRVNIGYELSKIYQVIVLLLPDRETYERYQSQDDARSESYDEALLIQEWILDVYSSHPNLLTVNPVAEGQLDAKFDLVRRAIVGE